MLLVSPVALLTRPRIPVSVCFPTGISSCAWLSFLLHMKIPINGMLAITLSLMREPNDAAPETDWEQLRPVLDEVMHQLRETDREAILLRYLENQPFAEIGARCGLNENAARMRVDRALEKLRGLLARRGVMTAAALASVISAHAVQVAPVSLG